jgi:biotin-dependent carboxylase-like uncharacterized protein
MDRWALQLANALVGNEPGAPALEWAGGGGMLRFSTDATIALAGVDPEAVLGHEVVDAHRVLHAKAGEGLSIGRFRSGQFLYVAVRGGLVVPPVLGSAATYLPAGLGGVEGRSLRRGDVLPIGPATGPPAGMLVCPPDLCDPLPPEPGTVRVVRAPQAELLDAGGWERLLGATFTVSRATDRMGYRLDGPPVPIAADLALPSGPNVPGAVQLPPGGQPIVLMADAPTVGGYPKPIAVCSADLGRLAQTRPGEAVRFVEVGVEEAQRLYRRRAIAVWTVGMLPRGTAG